jgi:hypothetical protein
MTKLTLDDDTAAKLQSIHARAELCDSTGRIVGYFQPLDDYSDLSEEDRRGPYTREQLQQFRNEPGGKPLSEILKRLREL